MHIFWLALYVVIVHHLAVIFITKIPFFQVLLSGGADVNAYDYDGLTSLHCAASRGHSRTINILLEQESLAS